jgi:hypothetical protein
MRGKFAGAAGATAMSGDAFLVVAFLLGYLLGSIPFGLLLTKLAGTEDLRSIGSGSIGATNVLRTGRKGLAAATLICDALKGTLAVVIAGYYGGPNAAMLAALGAFLGHLFPVWLKFRGGRGQDRGEVVALFLQRLLHKPRRRQRLRIGTKPCDHLHPDRQSTVGDISGNIDTGHAHQRPEPVVTGITGRTQSLRRSTRR